MYYVYALHNSLTKKIYIGQTGNISKRLREHNEKRGNHFTAKVPGEWILIYQEEVETRTEAIKRERSLKSYKGREFLRQFIPR